MTAVVAPPLGLASDYVPAAGARSAEMRSYGRMVRMVGRGVAQPTAGTAGTAGTPVLLVPGFLSGDVSLTLLSRELRRQGHRTFRAEIGANVGCTEAMVARLLARVEAVVAAEGRPATLVGHSRGGMITALAARRRPDLVAELIVLSAPITGTLAVASHVRKQLEFLFRLNARGVRGVLAADCVTGACAARVADELASPFPSGMPFLSIYSRNDAVLDWRTCLDPAADLVEVGGGHVGMATDPSVVAIVAERLRVSAAACA